MAKEWNPYFPSRGGRLACEGVPLRSIAARHGTPCYVTSAGSVRAAIAAVRRGFVGVSPLICYAMKANASLGLLRLMAREGCGAEVVSEGELRQALRAGIPAARMTFSGVGKTAREISFALSRGIGLFNVESLPELHAVSRIARSAGVRARVALRVNPGVDAHTHRYITTGTSENKFGIDFRQAEGAFRAAARLPGVDLAGVHCHIGSQITSPGPFVAAVRRVNGLVDRLFRRGIRLRIWNLGGGPGVSYRPGQRRMDVGDLGRALVPLLFGRGMSVVVEPGRFLVAEAGVLVTRVLYVKRGVRKTFVIVDAGMDNLIRPCLYEGHHEIRPVAPRGGARRKADVVGPICESADFLGLNRRLPPLREGDLLAVFGTGAYGSTMASNYNGRRKAPQVLVDGRKVKVLRRRESYEDLMRGEA